MKFKRGSKVRFVPGTTVKRRGRPVEVDYNQVHVVISTTWSRSAIMVEGVGLVHVYGYQLVAA